MLWYEPRHDMIGPAMSGCPWARSEEPDHTGRMPGLLWVFARAHPRFVVPIMPKLNYGWQARARVKV